MVAAVSLPWWSEIDDGGKSLPDPVSLSSISPYGKETLVGLHSNKLESPELKTRIEALTEIRFSLHKEQLSVDLKKIDAHVYQLKVAAPGLGFMVSMFMLLVTQQTVACQLDHTSQLLISRLFSGQKCTIQTLIAMVVSALTCLKSNGALPRVPDHFQGAGKRSSSCKMCCRAAWLVLSPRDALSKVSAAVMRNKHLKSGMSQSYTNQRDKSTSRLTGYSSNGQRFEDRNSESQATLASQGVITQLSEHISSLNDRMDEFTNRIEELNSKLTVKKSSSQQSMAVQAEACNGSTPTYNFISSLGNGSLTGSIMPNSSSSAQLAKESPALEEISNITRGQRQIMHQLDNLNNLLRESMGERNRPARTNSSKGMDARSEPLTVPLAVTLAVGVLGVIIYKGILNRS